MYQVVIAVCVISSAIGKGLTNDMDNGPGYSQNIIMDLQRRMLSLENRHNKDTSLIAGLLKQHQADQKRLADLEEHQRSDQNIIAELKQRHKVHEDQMDDLKFQHLVNQLRIDYLEKHRQTHVQTSFINNTQRQRQVEHDHDGGLMEQHRNNQHHITDLSQKQQVEYHVPILTEHQPNQRHVYPVSRKHKDSYQYVAVPAQQQQISQRKTSDQLQQHQQSEFVYERKTASIKHSVNTDNLPLDDFVYQTSSPVTPEGTKMDNRDRGPRVAPAVYKNTVAFHAVLTTTYSHIGSLMEIRFDKVITNIGNSYNPNTGTFTCPVQGVYVFSWSIHVDTRFLYTDLVHNGAVISTGFSGDTSPNSGIGRGMAVVELEQGDDVLVRVSNKVNIVSRIAGGTEATDFSGFMLH